MVWSLILVTAPLSKMQFKSLKACIWQTPIFCGAHVTWLPVSCVLTSTGSQWLWWAVRPRLHIWKVLMALCSSCSAELKTRLWVKCTVQPCELVYYTGGSSHHTGEREYLNTWSNQFRHHFHEATQAHWTGLKFAPLIFLQINSKCCPLTLLVLHPRCD